ncbi:MAG: prepilin-type N-terminal cleavage/methylation domain-containing protein [Phycisphaerales bacterium]
MLARKQVARGFTLVEILIVVVILGILAAIVIPQFTNASESARSSSLTAQLQTLRSQLELYQVQHLGSYPAANCDNADGDGDWTALTAATELDGTAGNGDSNDLGPYLQQPPINAFENSSTFGAAGAGVGWVYTPATGQIRAVMTAAKAADLNMDTTNDVTTYVP